MFFNHYTQSQGQIRQNIVYNMFNNRKISLLPRKKHFKKSLFGNVQYARDRFKPELSLLRKRTHSGRDLQLHLSNENNFTRRLFERPITRNLNQNVIRGSSISNANGFKNSFGIKSGDCGRECPHKSGVRIRYKYRNGLRVDAPSLLKNNHRYVMKCSPDSSLNFKRIKREGLAKPSQLSPLQTSLDCGVGGSAKLALPDKQVRRVGILRNVGRRLPLNDSRSKPFYKSKKGFSTNKLLNELESSEFLVENKSQILNSRLLSKQNSWKLDLSEIKKGNLSERLDEVIRILVEMKIIRKMPGQMKVQTERLERLLAHGRFEHNEMNRLEALLKKFLLGRELTAEDLKLTDLELVVFVLFLVKKKFEGLTDLKWTPLALSSLRHQTIKKRREQNYKVILKRFLKIVISDFNRRNDLPKKNDEEFYRHYFRESIEDYECEWQHIRFQTVFNETRVNKIGRASQRCSKQDFAFAMAKSHELMDLLDKYLKDKLVLNGCTYGIFKEYSVLIKRKVALLLFKWREDLDGEQSLKRSLADFVASKVLNDKVKLPWGLFEIEQGVGNVRDLFDLNL